MGDFTPKGQLCKVCKCIIPVITNKKYCNSCAKKVILEQKRKSRIKAYHENPEKFRKRRMEYYIKNIEVERKRARNWGQNNKEKKRECYHNWYQKNKEKRKLYGQKWVNEHRKYINYYARTRRLKRKNAKGTFTFKEWEKLKEKYHYTCPSCKKKEPEILLTIDHIVPIDKGGWNYIWCIQPLCKICNSIKHTKIKYYEPIRNF